MNKLVTTIISLLLLAWLSCGAFAANIAPSLVNYQARLTSSGGTPLNGNYSLIFTIYDAPTGGNIVWQETHSSVAVSDGFLSVSLGAGTIPVPLNDVAFGSDTRYLGVKIGTDPEISPRSRMVATPYSQRVNTVDQARGGIISGQLEVQSDASKDGDLVSAAIKVQGASLRVVSIQPSLNIALLGTSADGEEVVRLDALDTGGALRISGSNANLVASVSATGNGGNVAVNSAAGDVAAQLSAAPGGGQVELYNNAKDVLVSSLRTKITPEELVQFGATSAESLIVLRHSNAAVGEIVVADYTNPTPATVAIGNGTALSMKNSSGQTVVNVDEVGASFSGNLSVEWSLAKVPGENFTLLGANNTCDWNLPSNPDAHAENVFVVGQDNLAQSKDVFILGTNNQIRDDSDPTLNGNRSAVIGLNNIVYGDDSFCFGKNNYIGATSSAAFGQRNFVNGSNNNFVFGDTNEVTGTGNASVLGGNFNLLTSSPNSAIAGGFSQTLNLSGYSFIGAGYDNNIVGTDEPTHRYNAIGGGYGNDISSAGYATVAGGRQNVASGDAATIAGGRFNIASGAGSAIVGGTTCQATGTNSAVLGGYVSNATGSTSLAAGFAARANHNGAVVISAYNSALPGETITSGGVNQMVLRAPCGLWLTNSTAASTATYDCSKLINTPGGAFLSGNGGTWTNSSDRASKENFTEVNPEELLEKIALLPVTEWNYIDDGNSIRHIGPVAQDFYSLFKVGADDKHISTIDPSGVALAAIQALYKRTQQLQDQSEEIETLKKQLAEVQSMLTKLAAVKK